MRRSVKWKGNHLRPRDLEQERRVHFRSTHDRLYRLFRGVGGNEKRLSLAGFSSFFFRAAEPSAFTWELNCDFLKVPNISLHFPTKRSQFLPRDVQFVFFISMINLFFSATGELMTLFFFFPFFFFFSWKGGGMLFHCPETDLRNKSYRRETGNKTERHTYIHIHTYIHTHTKCVRGRETGVCVRVCAWQGKTRWKKVCNCNQCRVEQSSDRKREKERERVACVHN